MIQQQLQQQQQPDHSNYDIQIDNPQNNPQDTVNCIQFSNNNPQIFACSTWDGKIHVYKLQMQNNTGIFQQALCVQYNNPITCICWKNDDSAIYAGCGDFTVRVFNLQNGQNSQIGMHQQGIVSIFQEPNLNNQIITCSLDGTIGFWAEPNQQIFKLQLKNQIYNASLCFPILALGLGGEELAFISLQNQYQSLQSNISYFPSPLGTGSQLNSIKVNTQGSKYAIGSVDGRVNLGKITRIGNQIKIETLMTFKGHKIEERKGNDINQMLFPVNQICFNSRSDKFLLTSGSEGSIYFWDCQSKQKIKGFFYNKQPVSACQLSQNGQFMVYALGYDWHMGYQYCNSFNKPKVFIHVIEQNELQGDKN